MPPHRTPDRAGRTADRGAGSRHRRAQGRQARRHEQHGSRRSRNSPCIYGREAQNFDIRIAKAAPPSLRERFLVVTAKFREVLQLHARMLARVKNASEGMIQAIAREVERMNAPTRTYGPARAISAQPVRRDGLQQGGLSRLYVRRRRTRSAHDVSDLRLESVAALAEVRCRAELLRAACRCRWPTRPIRSTGCC